MTWRWVGLASFLALGLLLTAAQPSPITVYVALGDSVAAGAGASRPELSYVGHVLAWLREHDTGGGVRLSSYAGGGATSDGLRRWQVPAAVDELVALRRGERPGYRPGPVTITIGGNDLLQLATRVPRGGQPPSPTVVSAAIERVEVNLGATVADLLAAGGPGTTIVLTTYYDPFAGHSAIVSPTNVGYDIVPALNAAIARVAERHQGRVRVARVEHLLPADKAITDYLADPIHPNDRGHAAIAAAVTGAWAGGA